MPVKKSRIHVLITSLFFLFGCSQTDKYADRDLSSGGKSAYEIFGELLASSVHHDQSPLKVLGSGRRNITWGAEKEGSSSFITRIYGPDESDFAGIFRYADEEEKEAFLRNFFSRWMDNRGGNSYRVWIDEDGVRHDSAEELLDGKGRNKRMNISFLDGFNPETASFEELEEKWEKWLSKTNDSPFSYLTPKTRRAFFRGEIPHLSDEVDNFGSFEPLIGKPQKYMEEIEHTSVGWEVKFVPQKSYGEFQEMITWFRKTMGRNGELFDAPGHQRMVFPIGERFKRRGVAELTKAAQALIVIEGIMGQSGIETADYKDVIDDGEILSSFEYGSESDRGPLRIDREDRFVSDSLAIEFRSGTKNPRIARFIQAAMASRISRNDFSGLADPESWELKDSSNRVDADDLVERFGLNRRTAEAVTRKLQNAYLSGYNIALWNWYAPGNPILSETKQAILRDLTINYLKNVASLRTTNEETLKQQIISLQRDWMKASNLAEDIRAYMTPERKFGADEFFHHYTPETNLARGATNVNEVDLGIEYSARFPVRFQGDFRMRQDAEGWTRVRLADDKMSFLQSRIDMTPEEKDAFLKKLAIDLRDELGGSGEPIREAGEGHGHGLGILYEIRDSENRTWRVEWDGIGRTYDALGNVIENSVRAGSVEVVTPKFQPKMSEMEAVFKAFEKNSSVPYIRAGGGHLNIDLAVFDGNPKALARFLAIFHEHRSVIAFLFQDMNRLKSAEPVEISEQFARRLANWSGSETDLKKALYNERYFNTRVGRKARYTHFDLSAYFQDVIPPDYISDDFDISNPDVKWRPSFRVEPHIRKGEVRLMNAPRDEVESALQIKLFRAIMHKALNTEESLSGNLQDVPHEKYLENPERLFDDLKKMTDDLGLDYKHYHPSAGEALYNADVLVGSRFYRPLREQLRINPVFEQWGEAVRPRGRNSAISSTGREYQGPRFSEQDEFQRMRQLAIAENQRHLAEGNFNYLGLPRMTRKNSCPEIISQFFE